MLKIKDLSMVEKTLNYSQDRKWYKNGYIFHHADFKNLLLVISYCTQVLLYVFLSSIAIPSMLIAQEIDVKKSASIHELVLANRVLSSSELGVLDTYGQVSFRNPENPNRYFIARRVAAGMVTKYDIYESDLDGNPITANRTDLYSERYLHGEIYKADPNIHAIAFVQTPELLAFSASSVPLRSGKPIPKIDLQKVHYKQANSLKALEARKKITKSLEVSDVVLLPGHGAIITGKSIVDMVRRTTKLRENASVQIQTAALQGKVNFLEFGPRQAPQLLDASNGGGNSAMRPWQYWTKLVSGDIGDWEFEKEDVQMPATITDEQEVYDLALANRILSTPELGIIGAYGHVSVRSRKNPNRYYISTDVSPGIVNVHDMIENDFDSKAIHDTRSQYEERFIHGEIYKARPDVMAIVHAHTAEFVAFSLSSVPLLPVFDKANFIGNGLPIFDIRRYTGGGPAPVGCAHCISTPQLGKAMAAELGDKPAILLYGHGIAVTGNSIADMTSKIHYLRKNAAIQQMAISLGGQLTLYDSTATKDYLEHDDRVNALNNWEFWNKTLVPRFKKEILDQ